MNYPRPWKELSREFTGKYEVTTMRAGTRFNVRAIYRIREQQEIARGRYIERNSFDSHEYDLNFVLRTLDLTDKESAIINLASDAFNVIEGLFTQYNWKKEVQANAAAEKRKEAKKLNKQLNICRQRLLNKRPVRIVEV